MCIRWDSPHSSATPASKPVYQTLLSDFRRGARVRAGRGGSGDETRFSPVVQCVVALRDRVSNVCGQLSGYSQLRTREILSTKVGKSP